MEEREELGEPVGLDLLGGLGPGGPRVPCVAVAGPSVSAPQKV